MAILLLPPPRDQHGNQDDGDGNQHPVLERRTNEHEVLCQPSAQPRSGMTLPPLVAITAPYLFSLAEIMASVLLGGPLVTSS